MKYLLLIVEFLPYWVVGLFYRYNLKPKINPYLFIILFPIKEPLMLLPAFSATVPGLPFELPVRTILGFGTDLILLLLLTDNNILRKFSAFILGVAAMLVTDAFCYAAFTALTGISLMETYRYAPENISKLLVANILFDIIHAAICFAFTLFLSGKNARKRMLKDFVPAVLIISVQLLLIFTAIYRQDGTFTVSFIIFMIIEVVICILADIYLIAIAPPKAAQTKILQEKLHCIEEVREGEKATFTMLLQKEKEMAELRHDWNNLLQTAMSAGENGKADIKLLKSLSDRVNATKPSLYCENETVNALLNAKTKMLAENNIDFTVSCILPRSTDIDALDLCSVFSNLIDNAAEYCISHPSDKNNVTISCKTPTKDTVAVRIENYAADSPVSFSKTTKSNTEAHGLGIGIVKNIAEKYDGHFDISFDNNTVTADVLLSGNV